MRTSALSNLRLERALLVGLSCVWLMACGDSGTSPGGGTSTGGTSSTGGEGQGGVAQGGEAQGGNAQGGEAQGGAGGNAQGGNAQGGAGGEAQGGAGGAGQGGGGAGQGGAGGGMPCVDPVASASNDGPACAGDTVALSATTVAGATYQWTGPNGFSSTQQSPMIASFDPATDAGTYTLVVTVDGCASAPATTDVAGPQAMSALDQTLSADFAMNQNTSVETSADQVTLASALDFGSGADGVFAPMADTTLAGGSYQFSSVTIPAGVTVTVTGGQPLELRSTGLVMIAGTLEASGLDGGDGVTFVSAGLGGAGRAGGGNGGDGTYAVNVGPVDAADGTGPGFGGKGQGWSGGGGAGHVVAGMSSGGVGGLGGAMVGAPSLIPPSVGSGGGGGSGGYSCGGGGGGGGGGFVHITAPSIVVSATGALRAVGGRGGSDGTGNCGGGGGGSGGGIHLSTVDLTHSGTIAAQGGQGGNSTIGGSPYFGVGALGAMGRVRFDYATANLGGSILPSPGFTGGATASTGSTVSPVLAPNGLCTWGTLSFTASAPMGTALSVDVLDDQGALLVADVASGTDLGAALAGVAGVRLRANLSTSGNQTPALQDWSLGYSGL